MLEAINVLLKRNPELRFDQLLDIDSLISEAVKLFQQQTNSKDSYTDFYKLPITLVGGSTGYMIRAMKNDGTDGNMTTNTNICKIS